MLTLISKNSRKNKRSNFDYLQSVIDFNELMFDYAASFKLALPR